MDDPRQALVSWAVAYLQSAEELGFGYHSAREALFDAHVKMHGEAPRPITRNETPHTQPERA